VDKLLEILAELEPLRVPEGMVPPVPSRLDY
jgi:hypothetical protein